MGKVDAFGFGITKGNYMKFYNEMKVAKGFVGFSDHPQGLVCVFKTENDAKICRNIMEFAGCKVGKTVFRVAVDEEYTRGGE